MVGKLEGTAHRDDNRDFTDICFNLTGYLKGGGSLL